MPRCNAVLLQVLIAVTSLTGLILAAVINCDGGGHYCRKTVCREKALDFSTTVAARDAFVWLVKRI
jgi:hypothetical protein